VPHLRSPDVLRARSIARLVSAARVSTAAFSPFVFLIAFVPALQARDHGAWACILCALPLVYSAGILMREMATERALRRLPLASMRAALPFTITGHAVLWLQGAALPNPLFLLAFVASLTVGAIAIFAMCLVAFSFLTPHFHALERPAQDTPAAASRIGALLIAAPVMPLVAVLYMLLGQPSATIIGCLFGAPALAFLTQSIRERIHARRDRKAILDGAPMTATLTEMAGLEGEFPLHERDRECSYKNLIAIRDVSAYRSPALVCIYMDKPVPIAVTSHSPA
jgi:hypothetical protein